VSEAHRRDVLRQAACVAAGWSLSGAQAQTAQTVAAEPLRMKAHTRSQLVDAFGRPLLAKALEPGVAHVFTYPFVATPAFVMALPQAVAATQQSTENKQPYQAPAGVGARQQIVAFSAICAHKLMYPTPQISFIGLRAGVGAEPAQVIHCCGDDSRYDPAAGARVLAGPAPQPLAAIVLEWDAKTDHLWALGVQGSDRFAQFFDKYAFKLDMEHGAKASSAVGPTTVVQPAASYSRQQQRCKA
jgi:arsenite oxidase small subunit